MNFYSHRSEIPNPPMHTYRHRCRGRDMLGYLIDRETVPIFLKELANRGEPLAKFWSPGTGGGGHMPPPPSPPGPPRRPPSPPPHTPSFRPGEWIPQGEGVQQSQSAPATGLADLCLSDFALHSFAAALQGVATEGVTAAFPSPALSGPTGKVATLSLLHLRFAYGVAVDVNLPPIWESVARGRGKMDGLATLNQALMRGLPYCCRIIGGRAHFSASPPPARFCKKREPVEPLPRPRVYRGGGSRPG